MARDKRKPLTSKKNDADSKASNLCGQCNGSGRIAETVKQEVKSGEKGKPGRTFSSVVMKKCDTCNGYGDYYRGKA